MECVSTKSKAHCSCTYTSCPRHGNCCQCVVYHRDKGEMVGCYFTAEGERGYDRSMANFKKDQGF